MSILDIAQQRNGKLRDGYSANKAGVSEAKTRVEYGTAQSNSTNGYVTIQIDNSDESFDVACDAPISSGDRVAYISTNGNGKAVSLSTITSVAQTASSVASAAQAIADAINQHFWADSNGIHVSIDEDDPAGEQNILINASGILLRAFANYLMALSAGAIEFYDGNGNTSSNIVTKLSPDGVEFHTKDPVNPTTDYCDTVISQTGYESTGKKSNNTFTTMLTNSRLYMVDYINELFDVSYNAFDYLGLPCVYVDESNDPSLLIREYNGYADDKSLPLFKIAQFTFTTPSIANTSGSSGWLTIGSPYVTIPTGYKAIGIVGVDSNHGYAWTTRSYKLDTTNNQLAITYTNTSTTNQTCTFTLYLLCVPAGNFS